MYINFLKFCFTVRPALAIPWKNRYSRTIFTVSRWKGGEITDGNNRCRRFRKS